MHQFTKSLSVGLLEEVNTRQHPLSPKGSAALNLGRICCAASQHQIAVAYHKQKARKLYVDLDKGETHVAIILRINNCQRSMNMFFHPLGNHTLLLPTQAMGISVRE
jgi:hypothetical protein